MKRGDIVQLGRHRLMCGDCTEISEVSRLFDSEKASTVIFSPPYKQRRKYDSQGVKTGATLFIKALQAMPIVADVQVFAVVGNLHHNGEQDMYYEDWLKEAQREGWRRFSTYIWDKAHGLPGHWSGRLAPCFEWIFHLNKVARVPHKHKATIWGQGKHFRRNAYSKGNVFAKGNKAYLVSDWKIADSIVRLNPSGLCSGIGHPAVFPVDLPRQILRSYKCANGIVYDPMGGSGSTMLAAESLDLNSATCEISENYCEIAIERYHKHIEKVNAPSKPKRKVITRNSAI